VIDEGSRALAKAWILAHPDNREGHVEGNSAYNAALVEHRQRMLATLSGLSGFDLETAPLPSGVHRMALRMLIGSTTRSALAVRTPTSGFLEGGLLVDTIEKCGEAGAAVDDALERLEALAARSREAHVDALAALFAIFLGDRAGQVFTDVAAAAPVIGDFPWDD
jgi:hypothetical protein